ncbi:olfactory receptor 4C11-like [Dromiciops gliroides]|uniref:olfactory receptor 4C11-like n=1 Tax=Dromiciops gliroides TaxID=33562 RepID=UPI001CC77D28|nr:olfactory receptor 4C11-like [Dromiciops gliroides]
MKNNVTEFLLIGLTQDPAKEKIVFVIILIFYIATILGNLLIIVTVKNSPALGSPMYFFLTYLSLSDACLSTTTAPRLIVDSLRKRKSISYDECMLQLFAGHFFGSMDILVLILMAYDRYVAICKPLHYLTIMSRKVCSILVALAWVGSFVHSVAQLFIALSLPFCGSNLVNNYCCDLQPLMRLACTDTYVLNLLVVFNSGAICMVSFIMLMISYTVILYSLRNQSREGRYKALSTCTTHIIVVLIFFGPCIFIYSRPLTTFPADKLVVVFYTIGAPLLNPLIYTLRNKEVKTAMRKLWSNRKTLHIKQ